VKVIESGYDIKGRRNNWQGSGLNNDIVPRDNFGAWRETWFTVCVLQKAGFNEKVAEYDKKKIYSQLDF